MTIKIITPPSTEPITLTEARLHLRIIPNEDSPPSHPDDPWILETISAAREWCENYTRRALAPQTVEVILDEFPDNEIQLPMSPIASITSIKYIDSDGNEQTLASGLYVLDNDQEPGWVLPLINTTWPATYGVVNSVRVRYEVGYTSAQDSPNNRPLPRLLKSAMLLLLTHWDENRGAVDLPVTLELALQSLLFHYQLRLALA